MFGIFEKKPTNMALYIAIFGEFAPNMFQTTWLVKHGIISDSDTENLVSNVNQHQTSIEFSYCRFEARPRALIFETDQLGFLGQTLDLVGLILNVLKNLPCQGIEAHILTHYDVDNAPLFIGKIHKNQFWDDIVKGDYNYNEIEIKIPKQDNSKLHTVVSIEVCPKYNSQIHINVRDSVFLAYQLSLIKEVNSFILEDIKSSFTNSISLINKIRNYEFE